MSDQLCTLHLHPRTTNGSSNPCLDDHSDPLSKWFTWSLLNVGSFSIRQQESPAALDSESSQGNKKIGEEDDGLEDLLQDIASEIDMAAREVSVIDTNIATKSR